MENRERDKETGLTFETYFVNINGVKVEKPCAIFIQSACIAKCINYMKENDLDSIVINSCHKYKLNHLRFLKENTFIKEVCIETPISDCSALNYLTDLEELSIHQSDTEVDFSNFKYLKRLNISWCSKFVNIQECTNLQELIIYEYPEKDLSWFKQFPHLKIVELFDLSIESLSGIEYLTKLERIDITRAKKLHTINGIETLKNTIKNLRLDHCKKLSEYTPIGALIHLQKLYILKCGVASNICFIEHLNRLEYGYIDINIADGQVELLTTRPIIFKNYKHFSDKNTLKIKVITGVGNELVRGKEVIKRFY